MSDPCVIKIACQTTMQELYKDNDTHQYVEDDVSPNSTPSSLFTGNENEDWKDKFKSGPILMIGLI